MVQSHYVADFEVVLNLTRIALVNVRNYHSLDMCLPEGLVVLCGENAQGKSNLLEAVFLIAVAKSYRASSERELVHWDALARGDSAMVTVEANTRGGPLQVRMGFQQAPTAEVAGGQSTVEKQIRVNGIPCRASELVGQLNAVFFTAADLDLVQGAPTERRRFLDILISQVDRPYLRALQRYQRVLTRRNHLLRMMREGRAMAEEVDFWDQELVGQGTLIISKRREVIGALSSLATAVYEELAHGERLEMTYRPSVEGGPDFQRALSDARPRELAMGVTVVGPHRDDLQLLGDGVDMGAYASRGEARTVALAMRLAEAAYLQQTRNDSPVLLLDDVLSELDAQRRRQVLALACRHNQALITTTDLSQFEPEFLKRATLFTVRDGTVAVPPGKGS